MLRRMFERFNEDARQVVVTAQEEARQLDHGYIGTEHMLLGLLESADESPAQALGAFGVDAERVRSEIVKRVGRGKEPPGRQIPSNSASARHWGCATR
jgi:ATP-dependent Clp protease ATP-binding subunit ClpC